MQTMIWAAIFYIVLIFGVIAIVQGIRGRNRKDNNKK